MFQTDVTNALGFDGRGPTRGAAPVVSRMGLTRRTGPTERVACCQQDARYGGAAAWARGVIQGVSVVKTVVIGVTGGLVGVALGIPAGGLLGSVAAVGIYSVVTDRAVKLPLWVRIIARIIMGTVIGSLLTRELVMGLGWTVVWAVVFTLVMLVLGALGGLLLSRLTGIERKTALMATCPGGMSELTLLSDQLGTDTEVILGVQLVRKVLTIMGIVAIMIGIAVLG